MIAARHNRWIRSALNISRKSNFPREKMAALLVKGGKVISFGLNRNSPGKLKNDAYAVHDRCLHAELDCILGLTEDDLSGTILYVAGKTAAGNLLTSAPCACCQKMLKELPLKAIYYHDKEGNVKEFVYEN